MNILFHLISDDRSEYYKYYNILDMYRTRALKSRSSYVN